MAKRIGDHFSFVVRLSSLSRPGNTFSLDNSIAMVKGGATTVKIFFTGQKVSTAPVFPQNKLDVRRPRAEEFPFPVRIVRT